MKDLWYIFQQGYSGCRRYNSDSSYNQQSSYYNQQQGSYGGSQSQYGGYQQQGGYSTPQSGGNYYSQQQSGGAGYSNQQQTGGAGYYNPQSGGAGYNQQQGSTYYNQEGSYGSQGGYGRQAQSENPQAMQQLQRFIQNQDYKQLVRDVSRRLGFKYNLNESVIEDIYEMCRYEKAW